MRSRVAGLLSVVIATGLVATTAAAQERSSRHLTMHALVSDDTAAPAPAKDASLVNGWGLSAGPTTPWWVSNNGTNTSTLYSGGGAKAALTVAVPGGPTGTVFNGSGDRLRRQPERQVSGARASCSRRRPGRCSAGRRPWTRTAAVSASTARRAARSTRASPSRATGCTRPTSTTAASTCSTRVQPVATRRVQGSEGAEGLRAVRHPGDRGSIFVTYAKQDAAEKDDVPVPGQAYVDEFTPDGQLVARVDQQRQEERAAERAVGARDGAGRLRRLSAATSSSATSATGGSARTRSAGNGWVYKGQLRVATGAPIAIDGLWAIAFGNGAAAGPTTTLYFLAGPSGEKHGPVRIDHGRLGAATAGKSTAPRCTREAAGLPSGHAQRRTTTAQECPRATRHA